LDRSPLQDTVSCRFSSQSVTFIIFLIVPKRTVLFYTNLCLNLIFLYTYQLWHF
jgi:hypothetical protein